MTAGLLALGYVLAVPFTFWVPGFYRMWRRREPLVFAAQETGAVLVTLGWALQGNAVSAALNGAWTVGFAGAYAVEGRKRARARAAARAR